MRPDSAPVPVVPVGALSTTSLVWQWRDACNVTVAAKATFALQHRRVMSAVAAEPIEDHEIVPYRPAVDVLVTSAHAFSDQPTEAMAVRLVLRGRRSEIDKSLLIYAPRPGGVVAPFQHAAIVTSSGRPEALVIDPQDPSQRGTFGKTDGTATTLEEGDDDILIVDDDVDWSTFHVAPRDQRPTTIDGDEWLILEGMTPGQVRLESRLPGALVETRVYGPDLWCGRSLLVTMTPSTVSLDVDRLACSITWSGSFTVDSIETARTLAVVSALHLPGGMTSWPTVEEVASSLALAAHRAKLAGLADTTESTPAAHEERVDEAAQQVARVEARLQALGPMAAMPVENVTPELAPGGVGPTTPEDAEPRMLVHRTGVVRLVTYDQRELSVTDTGTLDLPPDRRELAPPTSEGIGLRNAEDAPWGGDAPWQTDPARRAAGGTVIADDVIPPEIDDQDVDTLERTLTDSLDGLQGDPVAELFDVGKVKKS